LQRFEGCFAGVSVPNIVFMWFTLLFRIWRSLVQILARDRKSWLSFSWSFSVPLGECWDTVLILGHHLFLPNYFQFFIHLSPLFLSTLYSLSYWKWFAKLQINRNDRW
jgi:hypothetical protein